MIPLGKRNISRRGFTAASAAAVGASMVAVGLSSCSSGDSQAATGEPQVVTDDSQIIAVLDGDYESADCPYEPAYVWDLPLGTMLFHGGGSWAAAMLTPESARAANSLGIMSLATGRLSTLIDQPTQGGSFDFFDVRCSDSLYAWVEVDFTDRSWILAAQALSNGALTGEAAKLDSGDVDWEPPRFTVSGDEVIWQKMPLATGGAKSEDSHLYIWTSGADEAEDIWTSTGRFATSPRVSGRILTIAPRVRNDEGVYYGMTAIDLDDENRGRVAQLVLPRTVSPFEAVYVNDRFAFSIEASYNGLGSLGNMGTFVGAEGGPYVFVRREPLAQVACKGARYLVKAQSSHFVVDTDAGTYATLRGPDRSVDYGDWPASEGATDQFLTYATVRNEQGIPQSVQARVFNL